MPRLYHSIRHTHTAVRDCLFNIFAVTLHIEARSTIRNLRTRHAVVKETHISHGSPTVNRQIYIYIYIYTSVRYILAIVPPMLSDLAIIIVARLNQID
jgi:hypothetical protein